MRTQAEGPHILKNAPQLLGGIEQSILLAHSGVMDVNHTGVDLGGLLGNTNKDKEYQGTGRYTVSGVWSLHPSWSLQVG